MPTVLVTRLMPYAELLIDKLERQGYEVMHESLLSIEPIYCLRPAMPAGEPLVVLTSRVTLDVLAPRRSEVIDLIDTPCYCVGDQTAEDAKAFGFSDVKSADGDGAALAELIMDEESPKSPILHIGGEDVHPEAHVLLSDRGWSVTHWPLYKAREVDDLSEHTIEALKAGTIATVLFHSTRAAQIFVKLVERENLAETCRPITAFGMSPSVAKALSALPFCAVHAADHPNEPSLIDLLHTHFPPSA